MKILFSPDAAVASPSGGTETTVDTSKPSTEAPKLDTHREASTEDPFQELDRVMGDPKKPDKAAPTDAKADQDKEVKADEKPGDKKVEPDKNDPRDKDGKVILTGPKALREQLEKKATELATVAKERDALKKQVQQFESKAPNDTKITEHIATLKKELDDTKQQLRAARREVSPEFKEKFEEPYNQAAGYAKSIVESLSVTQEDGTVRQGTWDDFRALYNQPLGKAFQIAKQMFGDAAPMITQQISELHKMAAQREVASKKEAEAWDRTEKENITRQNAEAEQRTAVWAKVNEDVLEKHPDFNEVPDDKELNELRSKSYQLIDMAFSNELRSTMTPTQKITLDAQIRHRAANYPSQRLLNARLTHELTELKAKIEELQTQGPTKPKKAGGGDAKGSTQPKGLMEDLEESMAGG